MSKGNLFIISGPSGTGKGTVCARLNEYDDIYLSVSVTTRNKRNDEIDGVTYIYDNVDGFKKRIAEERMLEWAQYGENFYGTPKDVVEEKLCEGINVILEIEVQGALKVKEKMPEAVMIFIVPPSMDVLKRRLLDRGRENEEEINKRINIAKSEFLKAPLYNHIVVNDDLIACTESIRKIIEERKSGLDLIAELSDNIK